MNNPAIVVIGYNRPAAITRLLDSLEKASYPAGKSVTLIISIDKSDNDDTVSAANVAPWSHGEKIVNACPANLGLKTHVLKCGDWAAEYGSIIVLEDDLYVSKGFYEYAVAALDCTEGDERIGGVSLYDHLLNVHAREPFEAVDDGYDNWYFQFASSWGQAYTARQWASFKTWYVENSDKPVASPFVPGNVSGWSDKSWLKYYIKYLIDTDRFFFYPRISYTTNFADIGEHAVKADTDVQVPIAMSTMHREWAFATLDESGSVYDAFYENMRLFEGEQNRETIVDLYGQKDVGAIAEAIGGGVVSAAGGEADGGRACKFCVSSQSLPYKVVRSYARVMRPVDANIIEGVEGHDLFLYDLSESGPAPSVNEAERYLYDYRALNADRMKKILKYRVGSIFRRP